MCQNSGQIIKKPFSAVKIFFPFLPSLILFAHFSHLEIKTIKQYLQWKMYVLLHFLSIQCKMEYQISSVIDLALFSVAIQQHLTCAAVQLVSMKMLPFSIHSLHCAV